MDFKRSRGINPFSPGDAVQCVDAEGSGLARNAIYRVREVNPCPNCQGHVRLTDGPRPTDSMCGWWRHTRFRHIRPPNDELTRRIRAARPAPAKTPDLEDA